MKLSDITFALLMLIRGASGNLTELMEGISMERVLALQNGFMILYVPFSKILTQMNCYQSALMVGNKI